MKNFLLIALLCFCVNAYAITWKKFGESERGDSSYIDVDNIKKHKRFVYYWMLLDRLEPLLGDYSFTHKYKADCKKNKLTELSATFYSQPMGRGTITNESTSNYVSYPKQGSISSDGLKLACLLAK